MHDQLERLPEKYRLPLVYAAIEGLDYETIGAMLKVRPGTVKTLVFRGRQLLKERVDAVLGLREVGGTCGLSDSELEERLRQPAAMGRPRGVCPQGRVARFSSE